jgi:Fe-S-cluster-containing dehydrogenase component
MALHESWRTRLTLMLDGEDCVGCEDCVDCEVSIRTPFLGYSELTFYGRAV